MLPIIIKTIGEIVDGSCCFDMITMVWMDGWYVYMHLWTDTIDIHDISWGTDDMMYDANDNKWSVISTYHHHMWCSFMYVI